MVLLVLCNHLQVRGVEMLILLHRTGRLRLVQGPRASKWQSLLSRPTVFPLPHGTCGHMGLEPSSQAHYQWVGLIDLKSRWHGTKEVHSVGEGGGHSIEAERDSQNIPTLQIMDYPEIDVLLTSGEKNRKSIGPKFRNLGLHSASTTHCGLFLFPCFISLICSMRRLASDIPDPSSPDSLVHLCLLPQVRCASDLGPLKSLMTEKHEQQTPVALVHGSNEGKDFGYRLSISPLEVPWKRH